MATAKKSTKKITQRKKVIKIVDPNEPAIKPVKVETTLTDEEKIFGATPQTVTVENIHYESPKKNYKVTNLEVKNAPVIVTGDVIETFIGSDNKEARKQLIRGAKEVITYDNFGNKLFKIEVI